MNLKLLARHALHAIPFNIVLGCVILAGGLRLDSVSESALYIWFGLIAAISLFRMIHVRFLLKGGLIRQNGRADYYVFLIGTALTGTIWGLGFVFFAPYLSWDYQQFFLLTLGGLVIGGQSSLSYLHRVYLVYLLPILLPPMLWFYSEFTSSGLVAGTLLLIFTAFMALSALKHRESSQEIVRLRLD